MAKERENEAIDRDAYKKGGPEKTETLNEYYFRKQSVSETELAPEAEIAGPDRDAEAQFYDQGMVHRNMKTRRGSP